MWTGLKISVSFSRTSCLFSPDDKLVVTGTSVKKGQVFHVQATYTALRYWNLIIVSLLVKTSTLYNLC